MDDHEENRALPRVLIAGGGVAGLEAAIALNHIAPGLADATLIAPDPDFFYKPLVVEEPFSRQPAARHELEPALAEIGTGFMLGALTAVDPPNREIELIEGERLAYDHLIVATGARARPAYESATNFWADQSDLPIEELLRETVDSPDQTLTFLVPPGCSWPLPLYELALMTRRYAEQNGFKDIRMRVLTPERAPLAVFGTSASEAVAELLRVRAIDVHAGMSVIEEPAGLTTMPGGRLLEPGPAIALPELVGPRIAGLPADEGGFIPIDPSARVRGIDNVYAAGDGANFPIKQGGLATQQADAAAEHIAARLGAAVEAKPFEPVLRGQLITGPDTFHMKHALGGGSGEGTTSLDYLWWPPGKVAGRYLAPWLAHSSSNLPLEPPPNPLEVEVMLPIDWHEQPQLSGEWHTELDLS